MTKDKTTLSVSAALADTVVLAKPLAHLHAARRRAIVGDLRPSAPPKRWAQISQYSRAGAALDAFSRLSMRLPYFGVSTFADAYLTRDQGAIASVVVGAPLACLFGVPASQAATHGRKITAGATLPTGAFTGYKATCKAEMLYTAGAMAGDRAARHWLESAYNLPADTKQGAQYRAAVVAGAVGGLLASVVSHVPNAEAGFRQMVHHADMPQNFSHVSTWSPAMKTNAMRALAPRLGIGALTGSVASLLREQIAAHVSSM